MKTYEVTVQDNTLHTYIIKASSQTDAEAIAMAKFEAGEEGEADYDVGIYSIEEK